MAIGGMFMMTHLLLALVPIASSLPPMPASLPSSLAAHDPSKPTPIGNFSELMSTDDYPIDALRDNKEGTVAYELAVDAAGKVTGCTVTASSGTASLDAKVCELMNSRVRFTPGHNRRGKAIAGSFTGRFTWKIPTDGLDDIPPPSDIVMEFDVTSAGRIINCRKRDQKLNRDLSTDCRSIEAYGPVPTGGKPIHVMMRNAREVRILDEEPVEQPSSTTPN